MSIFTYLDKVKAKKIAELTDDEWRIHWISHSLCSELSDERLRNDELWSAEWKERDNIIISKQYRLLPEHFRKHRNDGSYIGDEFTDEECMLEAVFMLARRLDIYTKILRAIPNIIKKNKGLRMTDEQMQSKILETLKAGWYKSWILGDQWTTPWNDRIDDYKHLIDYPKELLVKNKRFKHKKQ